MQIETPQCMQIVHWRMWMRRPHVLHSRIPSAFVAKSHHHACTTTNPPNQCQHAHHPITHTPLSMRSRAPYAHGNGAVHADRAWEDVDEGAARPEFENSMRVRSKVTSSRVHHNKPPEPVSACTSTHNTHASFSTLPHALCTWQRCSACGSCMGACG